MKRIVKITIITLVSILLFASIVVSITLWYVFSPEKLSPILKEQSQKYLTCEANFQSVELTFFSTYPDFGIKIKQLQLINPVKGAPNDTLIVLEELIASIDAKEWWKNNNIVLKDAMLENGSINLFYDSLGNYNYKIFVTDTIKTSESEEETIPLNANIENIQFRNINLQYLDEAISIDAKLERFSGKLNGKLKNNVFQSSVQVKKTIASLIYDHEPYLIKDTLHLNVSFSYWLDYLKLNIESSRGTINAIPLSANGTIEEDTTSNDLLFDLEYELKNAPVEKLVRMVPPSYQSYFNGIKAKGMMNIEGTITGKMNNHEMPMFYVALEMNDGTFQYEDIPLKLQKINGNIEIFTDAMTDSLTYLNINQLNASTLNSTFYIKGKVDQLFSDIACRLNANFDLKLDEFNALLPGDLKTQMHGNAKGRVNSEFTLTQLEKKQIEKIRLNGKMALSNFAANYDTLWLNTNHTIIDFNLPGLVKSNAIPSFLTLGIETENITAGSNDNYAAYLGSSNLAVTTSNPLDTTRIPTVNCEFRIDSLAVNADTISMAIASPVGKIFVMPGEMNPKDPHIQLEIETSNMQALLGNDKATMKKLALDVDIVNNSKQKDLFLQWLPKGFLEMEEAHIETKTLSVPLDIPAISMNFDPENFNIKESSLIVDKSDFQLKGKLGNIHSYFKGDSILKGDFAFTSNHTNLDQLMALTSGIGYEEDTINTSDTESGTGPYMVPKGIDIQLSTNIQQLQYSSSIASNLAGNVLVKDGILTLDNYSVTTPATRIQLTAIYRTPRKNHLYLGLDYHMLDIEIEKLLTMVPDIDSLMPMLRSFKGTGEYHMAIETYLDSLYNLKKSTLRGAASITGQDLVLLDGETFSEIAKTLKFNKKTVNKVDSLSAEFTIFKDEIDVYPFLIVMDKYKAVVAGRHNFDMSFDYHISVVDSPLPVNLGIDVKGTLDNLSYRLAPCRYAEGYLPFARRTVESKQLELRQLIKESLIQKVKIEE